jgi:N6-adenosine-specific RNA methylase IME4
MSNNALFDIAMIDPPWPKLKGGIRKMRTQTRDFSYKTLPITEIKALLELEFLPKLAPTCGVFVWTVDQFLWDAEHLFKGWGFKQHARFIWDKGNGVAPAFTIRYSHEYLLWFYRPKLLPVARDQRGKFRTVIREAATGHSIKPDAAYTMLETLYPGAKRLDFFARRVKLGWQGWGDQYEGEAM